MKHVAVAVSLAAAACCCLPADVSAAPTDSAVTRAVENEHSAANGNAYEGGAVSVNNHLAAE